MLRTWDDVFDAMGGPAEVGRAIGTTTDHAAGMKRRGRVPSPYWMDLVRDAQVRTKAPTDTIAQVTYEALATIDAACNHPQKREAVA